MPLPDPNLPMMMEATRRGRLATVALLLAVGAALATAQFVGLPMLQDLLKGAASTPPTTANVLMVKRIFLGVGLLGMAVAILLLLHARAIKRSGQNPPNDWWLWRDTFIVRGPRALRLARLSVYAALLVALLCGGLTAFIIDALDRAVPLALRPGVTIIEQKPLTP